MHYSSVFTVNAQERAKYRVIYDCDAQIVTGKTNTYRWTLDIGDTTAVFYNKNYKTIGNNKVGVPDAFFKVILRVNKNSQALGFIYPNDGTHHKMDFYVVTVDDVESLTGIDFFYNLSDETENKVESSSNLSLW